jgi:hypothetical protein
LTGWLSSLDGRSRLCVPAKPSMSQGCTPARCFCSGTSSFLLVCVCSPSAGSWNAAWPGWCAGVVSVAIMRACPKALRVHHALGMPTHALPSGSSFPVSLQNLTLSPYYRLLQLYPKPLEMAKEVVRLLLILSQESLSQATSRCMDMQDQSYSELSKINTPHSGVCICIFRKIACRADVQNRSYS